MLQSLGPFYTTQFDSVQYSLVLIKHIILVCFFTNTWDQKICHRLCDVLEAPKTGVWDWKAELEHGKQTLGLSERSQSPLMYND